MRRYLFSVHYFLTDFVNMERLKIGGLSKWFKYTFVLRQFGDLEALSDKDEASEVAASLLIETFTLYLLRGMKLEPLRSGKNCLIKLLNNLNLYDK